MMKMTEQTTLAELQTYLRACGDPFVTLMKGLEGKRHAIVHVPSVGTFHGNGETVAEALEAAFREHRLATLPEGLKQLLEEPPIVPSHPFEASDTGHCAQCGDPAHVAAHEAPDGGRRGQHGISLREQTERVMSTLTPREREVLDMRLQSADRAKKDPALNKFRQTSDELCHGCAHTRDDHPNDSGCQEWHDGSEFHR